MPERNYRAIYEWPEALLPHHVQTFLCKNGYQVYRKLKWRNNTVDASGVEIMIDGRWVTMGVTDYDSKSKTRGRVFLHAFVQGPPQLVEEGCRLVAWARDEIMAEREYNRTVEASPGSQAPRREDRSSSSSEVYVPSFDSGNDSDRLPEF